MGFFGKYFENWGFYVSHSKLWAVLKKPQMGFFGKYFENWGFYVSHSKLWARKRRLILEKSDDSQYFDEKNIILGKESTFCLFTERKLVIPLIHFLDRNL